jgi:DNA repair protein RadC
MEQREASPLPAPGPRERALVEGVGALGDAELIAVLLGTGLAGRPASLVAAGLLEASGGLANMGQLSPGAIAAHPGVGTVKALRIAAAMELGRRGARRAASDEGPLASSDAVAARMLPLLSGLMHEEMWLLALDGRNRVRATRRVAQGGAHSCAVGARDILRVALFEGATSMVLVHNHPSDDPTPSEEDLKMTLITADAALMLGVPLVDHVIVSPSGRYTSMLDMGIFTDPITASR